MVLLAMHVHKILHAVNGGWKGACQEVVAQVHSTVWIKGSRRVGEKSMTMRDWANDSSRTCKALAHVA